MESTGVLEPGITEAFEEFKVGLARLRDGFPGQALPHVARAAELERRNPFYISYLGLLLAVTQRRWADAEQLCSDALRMKRSHPQLHLNLAEVYLSAGRRSDAFDVLSNGLVYTNRHPGLRRALDRLGARRPPIVNFLPRGHVLNRVLGRVRYRLTRLVFAR